MKWVIVYPTSVTFAPRISTECSARNASWRGLKDSCAPRVSTRAAESLIRDETGSPRDQRSGKYPSTPTGVLIL